MDPTSSSPAEPVPTGEEHPQGEGASALESGEMSIVSDTVASAVRAVDGMRNVLEDLNDSIVRAQKARSLESRLGRLFLEAQEFVDRVRAETTEWANRMLEDAKAEAAEIVSVARNEAQQILEDTRRSSVSTEVVDSIQTTIETFHRANVELVHELARLNQALAQQRPPVAGESHHQGQVESVEGRNADRNGEKANPPVSTAEPLWPDVVEKGPFFGPEVRRWPAIGRLRQ